MRWGPGGRGFSFNATEEEGKSKCKDVKIQNYDEELLHYWDESFLLDVINDKEYSY